MQAAVVQSMRVSGVDGIGEGAHQRRRFVERQRAALAQAGVERRAGEVLHRQPRGLALEPGVEQRHQPFHRRGLTDQRPQRLGNRRRQLGRHVQLEGLDGDDLAGDGVLRTEHRALRAHPDLMEDGERPEALAAWRVAAARRIGEVVVQRIALARPNPRGRVSGPPVGLTDPRL
jgi:hypothetical protein